MLLWNVLEKMKGKRIKMIEYSQIVNINVDK